nr:unnamed protein product [Spirometra erinaceieuropaei]
MVALSANAFTIIPVATPTTSMMMTSIAGDQTPDVPQPPPIIVVITIVPAATTTPPTTTTSENTRNAPLANTTNAPHRQQCGLDPDLSSL